MQKGLTSCILLLLILSTGSVLGQVRVMPLGDSITKGATGSSPQGGYRDDLETQLDNADINFIYVGEESDAVGSHQGINGQTSSDINASISGWLATTNPDIVILHIGTNDISVDRQTSLIINDIDSIIEKIGTSRRVILSTIIPRQDGRDAATTTLNESITALATQKLNEGFQVTLADPNSAFKENGSWQTVYMFDDLHPNNAGYGVLAGEYFDAINANAVTGLVSDDFNRGTLGSDWTTDGSLGIDNGELTNSSLGSTWFMGVFNRITSPEEVYAVYGGTADTDGITNSGLALMLSENSTSASGYFMRYNHGNGRFELFLIIGGSVGNLVTSTSSGITVVPGDTFHVNISKELNRHAFDVFVNGQTAVQLSDPSKSQGNGTSLYSGMMMRGSENNNITWFATKPSQDFIAPGAVFDLAVSAQTANATLTWTAPGDDAYSGNSVTTYDVRFSEAPINESNFAFAPSVASPTPVSPGAQQEVTISGLSGSTTYYFAVKSRDDSGNRSSISNVASQSTGDVLCVNDDFSGSSVSSDWFAGSEFKIVNGELSNTAIDDSWSHFSIYTQKKQRDNGIEVSYDFGLGVTADGIGGMGIGMMFDTATNSPNGYLCYIKSTNEIRLFSIVSGVPIDIIDAKSSGTSFPQGGDRFKVIQSSDSEAHLFDFYVNDTFAGRLADSSKTFGNTSEKFAGVMLRGNRNNNIDNFEFCGEPGILTALIVQSGSNQSGAVGELLPQSIIVKGIDEDGIPVGGERIDFDVVAGGGLIKTITDNSNIFIEAEDGDIEAPMEIKSGSGTSGGQYVVTPNLPEQGSVTFTFVISDPGSYRIWGRCRPNSGSDDSFYFSFDDENDANNVWDLFQENYPGQWEWDLMSLRGDGGSGGSPEIDPVTVQFTAGQHTLRLRTRDANTKLDKILITKSLQFIPSGTSEDDTPITNDNGLAIVNWQIGNTIGIDNNQLEVKALDQPGVPSVFVFASGTPDSAASITKISGDNQSGGPGTQLPDPLVVELKDQFGNLVGPNVEVNFNVVVGNGSIAPGNPVLTDSQSRASVMLTTSTSTSTTQVLVTSPGYTGADVLFTSTASVGDASSIELVSGADQNGSAGKALANSFSVVIKDPIGGLVLGHDVIFTVINGGGNFSDSSQVTLQSNSLGIAEAILTLGPATAASNTVQVSSSHNGVPLTGSPVTFIANSAAPQTLEAISDTSQTGPVNLSLADSIKVRALDALGEPISGQQVTFSVVTDGFENGSLNDSQTTVTTSTGNNGIAKVQWRLGNKIGTNNNKITAIAEYNSQPLDGSPIEFLASAEVGSATHLFEVSGNNQSGLIQNPLNEPFCVKVTDGQNPVAGWPVTFTATVGGGNFSGNPSVEVATDANGDACAVLTLGVAAGTPQNPFNNIVEVSAENGGVILQNSPIEFQASAVASDAGALEYVSGNEQSGRAAMFLADSVRVKVTDGTSASNGIADHPVVFKITGGGGSINGTTSADTLVQVNTNVDGVASVAWYMGGDLTQNAQKLQASANDGINPLTGSPIVLQATATPGVLDSSASFLTSEFDSVAADGISKTNITITLTDKFGNPIPGEAITLVVSGTGNFIQQPVSLTDENGRTVASIASIKAEVKQVSARIIGGASLTNSIAIKFTPLAPDRIAISGGNNQTTNIGTALNNPLDVLITDKNHNPIPGISVTFEIVTGGGFFLTHEQIGTVVPSPEVQTSMTSLSDSNGVAHIFWALGGDAGINVCRALSVHNGSALIGSPVAFSATGIISNPTQVEYYDGNNQSGLAGQPLVNPLKVRVTDNNGFSVFNVPITFTKIIGDGSFSGNTSIIALTNYMGIAEAIYTFGTEMGINSIQASNGSLAGSPINFLLTTLAGQPAILKKFSGADLTSIVGSIIPISVQVTDIYANPVPDANISFEVILGGGSIANAENTTNDTGIAQAFIQMPTQSGKIQIRVESTDLPNFYTVFTLTAVPAPAAKWVEFDGNNQQGTVGKELVYPFQVQILDVYDNPVPDYSVNWLSFLGGGSPPSATIESDSNGVVSFYYSLGAQPGPNQVSAVSILVPSTITFEATGVTNNYPVFAEIADLEVIEGDLIQFSVTATDDDGDPLIYEASNLPSGAQFDASTRSFTWIPSQNQAGIHEVEFLVKEASGTGFDSESVKITTSKRNRPPVITSFFPEMLSDEYFRLGLVVNFSITAEQEDNDPLNYIWTVLSGNSSTPQFVSTTSNYAMNTVNFQRGTYVIKAQVSDGKDIDTTRWVIDLVTSVELSALTAQFQDYNGISVQWATSRELDNTGFNLLRSNTEDGSYIKINDKLIAPKSKGEYNFSDGEVKVGKRYFYMLEDVDINGVKTTHGPISVLVNVPEKYELSQNYPNPFNPTTKLRYQVPKAQSVKILIYDILGREVKTLLDADVEAGYHEITWKAQNNSGIPVSAGVYYYHIRTESFKETKKMLLMK